jgi:hypothetical protein
MMVGNWASPIELRVSSGTINLVKDFKYLGSWLLNCTKDFEIRMALAWKACIRLVKIWKSNSIYSAVKIKLFRACVESTLLSLALKITNREGTRTRFTPAKYLTDLDFADDIMLISDDASNSQKQLDSVDIMARRVGLKINRAKTEL